MSLANQLDGSSVSPNLSYSQFIDQQNAAQDLLQLIAEATLMLNSSESDPEKLAALLGEIDSMKSQIDDFHKETSNLLAAEKALSKTISALNVNDVNGSQDNANTKQIILLETVFDSKANPTDDKEKPTTDSNQQKIIDMENDLRKIDRNAQAKSGFEHLNSSKLPSRHQADQIGSGKLLDQVCLLSKS